MDYERIPVIDSIVRKIFVFLGAKGKQVYFRSPYSFQGMSIIGMMVNKT